MMENLPNYSISAETKTEAKSRNYLEIAITLKFDGSFLVNDKSKDKKITGDEHKADFNLRCDTDGKVILPVESFRGAFRSQAEKIIRTVGGRACTTRKPCKAVTKKEHVNENLCLACRLFGASGWKTQLDISQFKLETCKTNEFRQDFIAIDRFTGGGKDGAKFDAMSALCPVFSGSIRIDLAKVEPWGIGLLALTLRDLVEGDITFGFGAAKGYGVCTATVPWLKEQKLEEAVNAFLEIVKNKEGNNNG